MLIIVNCVIMFCLLEKRLNLQLVMIKININNETSQLQTVVVGIAEDFGGVPLIEDCYDPKSKEHVLSGTFSNSDLCITQMSEFIKILERHDVRVLRPVNISGVNQIFTRDIAFVIEDKLIIPNIIKDRSEELNAISYLLDMIDKSSTIKTPRGVRIEGGDVIVCNEYIFIGYSEQEDFEKYKVSRTNRKGVEFLTKFFPHKKIKGFELNKSDNCSRDNSLHLDCCFQPIGKDMAIIYKDGFKKHEDVDFLVHFYGAENLIEVDKEEMYNMNSNVFSISDNVIVTEKSFTRLNKELIRRGFLVEKTSYSEIAKMSGLLRCSTMPLERKS